MTPSGSFVGRRSEGIPLQAKAVGHDEDRGQGHRGGGEDRVEQAKRGQRDRRHVVAESPPEVDADRREGCPGQPDRVGHAAQVIAEQDHVGGADRHVGAGAEGEPEVGGRQGRAVVDAVADHRHPVPARSQPVDHRRLAGRQGPGDDLVDARLGGDRARRRLAVAGQQDRVQPERAQFGHGGGGRVLHRVRHRDRAADRAVPADQHRGPARVLPLAALPGQRGVHRHPVLGQQPCAPDNDVPAVDGAKGAQPGQRLERLRRRQRPALGPRGRADRRRDRVLGGLLDRARAPEQLGPADAVGGPHPG
jgi:hypothetical protein